MAFGNYRSLGEAALEHQVSVVVDSFIQPIPLAVDDGFRDNLTFTLQNINVRMSEAAIGEFVIAPVLREVWKPHSDVLRLWSHVSFGSGDLLQGVPDYYFSRRSPLGLVNDQPPYVLIAEAKKDDFDGGWGQCLAAMLAARERSMAVCPTPVFGSSASCMSSTLRVSCASMSFRTCLHSSRPGITSSARPRNRHYCRRRESYQVPQRMTSP